jgi:DNA-binding transcriptional LysR family regulator
MARNQTKYMESAVGLSEELNFTRAAQKLRISQPAITRNIAELEALLGFALFIRNRKTVTMTNAERAACARSVCG